MMSRLQFRDVDYLNHMLEAIKLARNYTEGLSREDFLADKKTQQAVILNILVIGEAVTKLADSYPEFVARHTDVPWQQMLRHAQSHGTRLFRDQSRHRMGHHTEVPAGY